MVTESGKFRIHSTEDSLLSSSKSLNAFSANTLVHILDREGGLEGFMNRTENADEEGLFSDVS